MSMPIARQGEQFDVFEGDRWARDRRASVSQDDVADMLRGPQITAGLNNTRQAAGYLPPEDQKNWDAFLDRDMTENPQNYLNGKDLERHQHQQQAQDWDSFLDRDMTENPHHYTGSRLAAPGGIYDQHGPYGSGIAPVPPSYWHDDEAEEDRLYHDQEHGLDREPPPEYDDYGPGPSPDFHDGAPQPFGTPTYNPRSAPYDDHPPSFNEARRHTADGGPGDAGEDLNGSTSFYGGGELFNPLLYMPGDRQNWRSELFGGGEAPHWPTASVRQSAPVVPQVADPVWLGHGYAPGNRIGLQWRDGTIPGTVTHLDGPNVGVRWDDGQHSTEEPQDIHRLH
jgi:hypothetical protein